MTRFVLLLMVFTPFFPIFTSDDSDTDSRPLTKADSVLAILHESMGQDSDGTPKLIFAFWPDGYIVWSENRKVGGVPYRRGQIDKRKMTETLANLEKAGLLDDKDLNRSRFGPDAPFITINIRKGDKHLRMQSWHELFEASNGAIAISTGVTGLDGQTWAATMKKEPSEYLYYRVIWSELRIKLMDLVPVESKACKGKLVSKEGGWHWQPQQ